MTTTDKHGISPEAIGKLAAKFWTDDRYGSYFDAVGFYHAAYAAGLEAGADRCDSEYIEEVMVRGDTLAAALREMALEIKK